MSPCTPTVLQCTTRFAPAAAAASMTERTAVALTARYALVRQPGLPVDRGDVVDDLDAAARRVERSAILGGRPRRARFPRRRESEAAAPDRGPARGRRSRGAASARARWPPVNPVAPVTRTRNAPPRPSPAIPAAQRRPSRASAPSMRAVTASRVRAACAARSAARTAGGCPTTRKPLRATASRASARSLKTR